MTLNIFYVCLFDLWLIATGEFKFMAPIFLYCVGFYHPFRVEQVKDWNLAMVGSGPCGRD